MRRVLTSRPFLLVSAALGFACFIAVLVPLFRSLPRETVQKLSEADLGTLAAGLFFLGVAFLFRAIRLNQLLARDHRLSLLRATGVSAAANVLYNIVPFRLGELAALALYRRATGGSWGRSAGLTVLIKVVDISTALLAGVSGALWLFVAEQSAAARATPLLLALAGAAALALLPFAGLYILRRIARRLGIESRLARLVTELIQGLEIARAEPMAYLASFVAGVLYLGCHLGGAKLVLAALGFPIPIALVAAATVASVTAATAVPSPAGTFGSSEAGFAAVLAVTRIPLATGFVLASAVHVAIVGTSALVALPILPCLLRKKGVQ
ncbi:MAG: flippase-like domain-containing protein [Thermoanaerobaculia bacterium]|nr:flippase-like domain-containing protein [Thermoanaerobaculia bacterium]